MEAQKDLSPLQKENKSSEASVTQLLLYFLD